MFFNNSQLNLFEYFEVFLVKFRKLLSLKVIILDPIYCKLDQHLINLRYGCPP